ncbi:unnamed protein product [Mytilus edulis]|uniref:Endonuclease/exonuclease/phosphatase domain-containing protein n=1 Tax=Mytilus edulis TaxID=6550 RepID=A0A8S3RJQ6_MYTED|nr:unnamed protein product [Mytilus edulis]
MGDKKDKKGDKSTTQILKESRNVLYGEETEIPAVLNNVLTLLNRMDTRLSSIEKNTGKNTTTLSQMNDKFNSLSARVIDAEKDIVDVKSRVTQLEATSHGTGNLFDEIKTKTDKLASDIEHLQRERTDFENRQENMKEKIDNLEEDKCILNDKLIDIQCRSMKYNLIFSGIEEHRDEDCEDKLRRFIYQNMRIEHRLEFGNVHRFGKSYRNKPRPIIARFLYFSDLDMIKRAGKNLKGTHYGVNQQFPAEIEEKRRKLYPIMKAERKNNSKVVLIRDKLYVNDELVTVSNDEAPREEPHQTPIRPKKRSRVSSTPDRDGHKSKTDDLDEIDIPNFEIKMKNRFTLRRVKSGGIVLCFRTHLADKINMVDTDSKYIMWFTVDKEIFRLNQNVLFGIVYIPPENSSYCIGDPYNEMENEFLNFCSYYNYICLMGDFNSRTSRDPDFIDLEYDEVSGMLDIENTCINTLHNLCLPIQRKSMDVKKNNFGNYLLDFCKYNNMLIVNGRIGDNSGHFTCKNASVVDYNICSPCFLKLIENFSVLETNTLFSDIHNPLSLTVKAEVVENKVVVDEPSHEKIKNTGHV